MKFLLVIWMLILISFSLNCQIKSGEEELAMMKQMGELTPKHDFLNEFVGDWNVNLLNYAGEDELAGSGTSSVLKVYRGHYLEINNKIDLVGAPMITQINIGYDTRVNQYFLISMDDVTNYPLILLKGSLNEKDKEITFTGKDYVLMYKKDINVKIVLKKERENKFTFKIYYLLDKAEKLMVEYHYIKKVE